MGIKSNLFHITSETGFENNIDSDSDIVKEMTSKFRQTVSISNSENEIDIE